MLYYLLPCGLILLGGSRADLVGLPLQEPDLLVLVSAQPELGAAMNHCHVLVKVNEVIVEPEVRQWRGIDDEVASIEWL